MSDPSAPDRRRAPRVSAKLDVAYEDEARQVFLEASDISEEGALIEDPDPPPEGSTARLIFALPESQLLRLRGEVRRIRRDPPGFAFHFDRDEMDEADREALRAFIAQVSQGSRDGEVG